MMNKQWYTIGLISVATVSLQAMDDRSSDSGSTDGVARKAVVSGSPRSQHSGADCAQYGRALSPCMHGHRGSDSAASSVNDWSARALQSVTDEQVPRLRLHSRHGSTGSEGGRASALSGSNGNEDTADDSDGCSGSHRNQVGELIEELICCSSNSVIAELLLVCIAVGGDLPHDDTADDDGGCSGSHMCPMGELIRCSTDQRRTVEMLVRLAMFGRARSMQRELPHGDAAGDGSQPDEDGHSGVDSSDETSEH